jgi:hypothetical protein
MQSYTESDQLLHEYVYPTRRHYDLTVLHILLFLAMGILKLWNMLLMNLNLVKYIAFYDMAFFMIRKASFI